MGFHQFWCLNPTLSCCKSPFPHHFLAKTTGPSPWPRSSAHWRRSAGRASPRPWGSPPGRRQSKRSWDRRWLLGTPGEVGDIFLGFFRGFFGGKFREGFSGFFGDFFGIFPKKEWDFMGSEWWRCFVGIVHGIGMFGFMGCDSQPLVI